MAPMELKKPVAAKIDLRKHIRELDGVRGIAILMVLIWHYVNCQNAADFGMGMSYLTKVSAIFWSGVDLFFVLSGFLIGGILLDYHRKPNFYRVFYIRRSVRILPVYFFTLACYFVCRSLFFHQESFSWLFEAESIPAAAYLTFTQNIVMGMSGNYGGNFLGVTWSLAVEEQFYLFLPLLLIVVGSRQFWKVAIVFAIAAPILRYTFPGFHAFVNTPFRMDALLVGVLLSVAFRTPKIVEAMNQYRHMIWAAFGVLLLGIAVMTLKGNGQPSFSDPTVLAIFYASFITLAILHQGDNVVAFLRMPFLTRLGMYSYGLYMYHQMVAGMMHGWILGTDPSMATGAGILVTLLSLAITIVLALLSFHTFETFFIKLGRRFRYDDAAAVETNVQLNSGVSLGVKG